MAPADSLTVTGLTVTEQPFFAAGGVTKKQTRVTFYVGAHGPFTRTYDEGQATTERIQADINAQVRDLRVLSGSDYTG